MIFPALRAKALSKLNLPIRYSPQKSNHKCLRILLKQFIFKVQKITPNLLSYDHIVIYSKKNYIVIDDKYFCMKTQQN